MERHCIDCKNYDVPTYDYPCDECLSFVDKPYWEAKEP